MSPPSFYAERRRCEDPSLSNPRRTCHRAPALGYNPLNKCDEHLRRYLELIKAPPDLAETGGELVLRFT